jgi:two-component system sensor histidine kinase HydH
MKPEWQRRIRYGGILLSILLISVLHYATSTDYRILHEIYQRIYYIPIIFAAFAYGPVGGIAASLLATILYAIHIQRDWSALPVYSFNQYAEILVFNVIALVVGLLSRREKRQRRQLERTSAELVEAYDRLQKAFEKLKRADRMAALGQVLQMKSGIRSDPSRDRWKFSIPKYLPITPSVNLSPLSKKKRPG